MFAWTRAGDIGQEDRHRFRVHPRQDQAMQLSLEWIDRPQRIHGFTDDLMADNGTVRKGGPPAP